MASSSSSACSACSFAACCCSNALPWTCRKPAGRGAMLRLAHAVPASRCSSTTPEPTALTGLPGLTPRTLAAAAFLCFPAVALLLLQPNPTPPVPCFVTAIVALCLEPGLAPQRLLCSDANAACSVAMCWEITGARPGLLHGWVALSAGRLAPFEDTAIGCRCVELFECPSWWLVQNGLQTHHQSMSTQHHTLP
jgi:hypothetical protein